MARRSMCPKWILMGWFELQWQKSSKDHLTVSALPKHQKLWCGLLWNFNQNIIQWEKILIKLEASHKMDPHCNWDENVMLHYRKWDNGTCFIHIICNQRGEKKKVLSRFLIFNWMVFILTIKYIVPPLVGGCQLIAWE